MLINPITWIRGLPSRHQQVLRCTVIFASLAALFISVAVVELRNLIESTKEEVFPRFVVSLGSLVISICSEAQFAIKFLKDITNNTAYQNYLDAQKVVDNYYWESFQFIEDHHALHSWNNMYPLSDGATIMTEQGLGPLLYLRSQLTPSDVAFNRQTVRKRYMDILQHITFLMNKCAHVYNRKVDFAALVRSSTLLGISETFISTEMHVMKYNNLKKAGADHDLVLTELKEILFNVLMFEVIVECLLKPVMDLEDALLFNVKTVAYNFDFTIAVYLNEATEMQVSPNDVSFAERRSFNGLKHLMTQMKQFVQVRYYATTTYTVHLVICAAFGVITLVMFIISISELLYLNFVNVKEAKQKRYNVDVMHDVLARVAEYAREVATFSLSPKPPTKTMSDRKVSIVEMQLEHLVGSLRVLAPSLNPLLFPSRLRELAEQFSEVKDPATMVLTSAPREDLRADEYTLQSFKSHNTFLQSTEEKTDLQERICDVALLFVSLVSLHDLGDADKKKFTTEFFQKIVSIVEECVYQHGGIMHSVAFDKAVAIWNAGKPADNFCLRATTCALALANRLSLLRSQKRLLRGNFPVHIGVVGGTVNIGVFGCEDKKNVVILGPPILRGMFVAQANGFHKTLVSCDDYVRDAVKRSHFCRPIELLPAGGCVHQILHESTNDEAELEIQLASYSAAFDLYERKYYKGALKAFREYTKMYGYDSSVERIQSVITETKIAVFATYSWTLLLRV